MAAASGEVVFRAGENNDTSDIWDDTALIEAYDQAISAIKNGGKNNSTKSKTSGKNRKQQSTKKKDKKKTTEQGQEWHVGDNCRAVYSEDELIYDAVIISLDASSNTCVVRFCGYGNKEEQSLDDLLPPLSKKGGKSPRHNGNHSGWAASPKQQSGDNDMDWTSGAQSPVRWQVSDLCLAPEHPSQHLHEAVINSFPTPYTCKVTFLRSRQRQDVDVSALKPSLASRQHRHHPHHHHPYTSDQRHFTSGCQFPSYPFPSSYQPSMNFFPPPPPPPMPPTPLPQHWPIPNPSGFQPPATSSTQFPFAPMPPPPAPVNSSDVSHDSDALASMLMAWYLSGYHTGYYQAMQNLRHGPNTAPNEAQVSTTDTDASKQESAELPTT